MGILSYIKQEIRVVRERDPAIKSNMEVLLYPSFKVILHYRVAHKLYRKKKTLFPCQMGVAAGGQEDGDRDPSRSEDREGAVHRPRKRRDHR